MTDFPQPSDECPYLLVTDFDGTMTERDFYRRALEHLPQEVGEYWEQYERDEITHFDALHGIFAQLPDDEEQVMAIARETKLDPDVRTAVETLRAAGWQTVVVSAGSEWYSRRLLAERGVEVPVISNRGSLVPGAGLQMERLPQESPFYCAEVGVDKSAVVRAALERFDRVAFAGDSSNDLPPAELVSDDRRFACGWLAEHFEKKSVPYCRFQHWSEISGALINAGGA